MSWYKTALRKHLLRLDPRIILDVNYDDGNRDAVINSFISSAVIKGLDIAGLVSVDLRTPWRAKEIAKTQNIDLFVIPGQIYKTSDGFETIVYNSAEVFQQGLDLSQFLSTANQKQLPTMIYNIGKQKAKTINRLAKQGIKPTFVEIFSAKSFGYLYVETGCYEVVSSGVNTVHDLEITNIYSHVPRKDMENMHIIDENAGMNYTPSYLQNVQQEQPQQEIA